MGGLHDKVVTLEQHDGYRWYNGHKSTYLTDRSQGYICALQRAGVEDLGTDFWSKASCKIYSEFGRIKMDATAAGYDTDAECGGACLETNYPVTEYKYNVARNVNRESGVTGVTREAMISTAGSVCWLSHIGFWQATHKGDWAECAVKANRDNMWELQATVKQKGSRTGSECGAVCMHQLPEVFKIEDEVIKHWDHSSCDDTLLGTSQNRTCFLSSMAVSHAYDWQERPRCDVKIVDETSTSCCGSCPAQSYCSPRSGNCYSEKKQSYYETCASHVSEKKQHWILRTCNGKRRWAETMCGARCVLFTPP